MMAAMQEFQQRVVDEKAELDSKLWRLKAFLSSDTFKGLPEDEQFRMTQQVVFMHAYSQALGQRIDAFV